MAAINPDPIPMLKRKWYDSETYYQILFVESIGLSEKKNEEKIITRILAKKRGDKNDNPPPTPDKTHPKIFSQFELDENTVEKLKNYRSKGEEEPDNLLCSYLPSPGVTFSKDFVRELSQESEQTELNNFYVTMRTLLHSRKLSQLIAKTWWAYLEAKKKGLLDKFADGDWKGFYPDDCEILDGLIAREIFLYGGGNAPDHPNPDEKSIYNLKPKDGIPFLHGQSTDLSGSIAEKETTDKLRFLILPNSKSWQGISLALLLAGQAYYKNPISGKYHQIAQPILSTGEIVYKYSLEVDWNKFNGDIKEIIISQDKPWVAYHAVMPYPPIPSDTDSDNLKKWADAEDEDGDFPFYKKKDDRYLIDVDYFRAPYPYVPLSCT